MEAVQSGDVGEAPALQAKLAGSEGLLGERSCRTGEDKGADTGAWGGKLDF